MSWAIVLTAIGLFIAGHVAGKGILFLPIAAILGGVGWIFSSLTVEVTATELIWFFGPGFWRKSIERDEIVSARACPEQVVVGMGHPSHAAWLAL
jgi:hypothetical protein